MRKPIIGLTPSVDEEHHRCVVQPGYLESVEKAGGLGLMLPLTDREEDIAQFVELCDGFLFVGGPDIEPWRYGQETLPECGAQNVQRDALEWKLLQAALARREHPYASLTELAAMMEPPITKPAMNHRLKKLVALAKE